MIEIKIKIEIYIIIECYFHTTGLPVNLKIITFLKITYAGFVSLRND